MSFFSIFKRAARPGQAPAASAPVGEVLFVGAGPGHPDLLTLGAARAIREADVILHDRLVSPEVLDFARPGAALIEVGKTGFGEAIPQEEINARLVAAARAGGRVVRLKGGDPCIFGRLDEEIAALDAAGLAWRILPGITASSAAAASIGRSLTRRERNAGLRIITGHDARGFADQDWRALAAPGAVAALYMGKRAARFVVGRLIMHGASADQPVSVIENASGPAERVSAGRLAELPALTQACDGPALILLGLAPHPRVASDDQANLALSDFPFLTDLLQEA
ncbi:uroporphyrinogen-III C-methyltransferase [Pseudothioclava arenosa]|uniref:uroporphyrinogen-III C-methyltransferase n=1 Tax=Pseudothioclava arenosa TaxID=1795308 RepID=A0A2A4CMN8_9RHOB|nr:uroporphyrinogen-III C-methyltransferase [Pseudothioclava arenosa]PCD75538.1 uroporphyrinogen-III C-methyltransferase [Pseudothioclava arenosa]